MDDVVVTAELAIGMTGVLSQAWVAGAKELDAAEGKMNLKFEGEGRQMDLNDLSVVLQKPVEAHGRTIEVLQLAEPTGQLVAELGEPSMSTADRGIKELPAVTHQRRPAPARCRAKGPGHGSAIKRALSPAPFLMPGETGEEE